MIKDTGNRPSNDRMLVLLQGLFPVLQWQQGIHADHITRAQHAQAAGPHPEGWHLPPH